MSLSFHSFSSTDTCQICCDPSDRDFVAHSDGGETHPSHRKCLKVWLKRSKICPHCRREVDVNSLTTWKDRVVETLQLIKNDAFRGAVYGTTAAISMGFAVLAEAETISTMAAVVLGGGGAATAIVTEAGRTRTRRRTRKDAIEAGALLAGSLLTRTLAETETAPLVGVATGAVAGAVAGAFAGVAIGSVQRRYFDRS